MAIRWESLGKGARVAVTPAYGFGADALLLARFASPRAGERVVDLGTGCGILPLLFLRSPAVPWVTGLEIQPEAAALARLSVEHSGFADRAEIVVGDWDCPPLAPESYRLAVCNPPYFPPGSGGVSASPAVRLARHETPGALEKAARAASRLLQPGGRFCLCHRPERLADVLAALRGAGLEPKRLRPVQQREGRAPWLVLAEGKKGGKPGLSWEAAWCMDDPVLQGELYNKE